ncbi:MAG TPA: tRNA pseudouridine(38-40) synthase TruA [Acidimicrobiales bacterium]|nr:tRNA pseudouridine(38-40) synthase TruA [Acidimicrobiales bacterium]
MRLFDPEEAAATAAEIVPDPAGATLPVLPKAAPGGPLCRLRLLVAYDGGPFHGFASQPGQATVGGRLSEALGRLAGHEVTLTCAGRTDAGVHAAGQVVHADVAEAIFDRHDEPGLVRSLTHQVGPEVAVLDLKRAEPGFDARRSALSRRYRYVLLRSPAADPLLRHLSWHVPGELDVAAMRMAADTLLGEHDFAAFCRRPPEGGSTVRRVSEAAWLSDSDRRLWRFEIEANAFCHQMVRSVVGALVSVGEGRLTPAGVLEILRSGERSRGSRLAPPGGLCLEYVRYPIELVPGGIWSPPGSLAVA